MHAVVPPLLRKSRKPSVDSHPPHSLLLARSHTRPANEVRKTDQSLQLISPPRPTDRSDEPRRFEAPRRLTRDTPQTVFNNQISLLISRHEQTLKEVTRFASRKGQPSTDKPRTNTNGLVLSQKQLQRFRQKLEKHHAFDYSRFSTKIAQHLLQHTPYDVGAPRSAALKFEVEAEEEWLQVRVVPSNQRFRITIDQLFEMVLDQYNLFWDQHSGDLRDLSAKLAVILDLRNFPREDLVRGLFWHGKPVIQMRLSRQSIRNFLIRNFDCQSIRAWVERQADILMLKRSTNKRFEQRREPSKYKSMLFPKISPSRRPLGTNDTNETNRLESNSSFASLKKGEQNEPSGLPCANELFAVLLCVYDRLLEHSIEKKFVQIGQQLDGSALHKDNIAKLTQDMADVFQKADHHERALIIAAIRRIDDKNAIVPINFGVNSLEGLLQKHTGANGESVAYYLKYFKNCFRQDTENASSF